jgi:hypothetical protein
MEYAKSAEIRAENFGFFRSIRRMPEMESTRFLVSSEFIPLRLGRLAMDRVPVPAQYGQFKHKEVMIGKLEPRMDANEREFLRSYKNS